MTTEWGRRLSDRLRDALQAEDYAAARDLCLHGDGYSRSLSKEFNLMFRGLIVAAQVLLDRIGQAIDTEQNAAPASDPAEAAAKLLQGFRQDISGLLGEPSPDHDPASDLSTERGAVSRILDEALRRFEADQFEAARAVIAAIEREDRALALALVARKETGQYVPLHDCLVRFMAGTFAWALRHFGDQALLRLHLATAQAMRPGFEAWERMPAEEFARATAFLLKQHMSQLTVTETPERFTFEQTLCGSGGRLRLSGAYEGPDALPFVEGPSALTFGKDRLPVYCSHCPVWNTLAPLNWFGHPHFVFSDPGRPDGGCTLHIYKRPGDVPADYTARYRRSE